MVYPKVTTDPSGAGAGVPARRGAPRPHRGAAAARSLGAARARGRLGALPEGIRDAPDDVPHELYIPNLSQLQQGIGGSSYVIAELDNAFTKYYEVTPEAEWRSSKAYVRASYVWSHYYGNFDQDNTSGDFIDNDFSGFVGSSNLADDIGREVVREQKRSDEPERARAHAARDAPSCAANCLLREGHEPPFRACAKG